MTSRLPSTEIQWCPRCQASVSVREVVREDPKKKERHIARYCRRCGISLSMATMPIEDRETRDVKVQR